MLEDLEEYLLYDKAKLALDFETYNSKSSFVEMKINSDDDEEEEEEEDLGIPRPLTRADGSITGQIRLIQIGLDPRIRDRQYVIDAMKLGYEILRTHLKPVLERAPLLGQNLKYEYQFAWVLLGIDLARTASLLDVMLMSQCLYAGDKVHHGLGDLYGRFLDPGWFVAKTGMDFDQYKEFKEKHQTRDWSEPDLKDDDYQYAADDVSLIFPLAERIRERIADWKRTYEYHLGAGKGIIEVIKLECSLIPVFAFMELRGIKLDVDYHRDVVIDYLIKKRDYAEKKVGWTRMITVKRSNGRRGLNRVAWEEQVEEKVNLRSWQQLKPRVNQLLADHVGPDVQIEKTSEDAIREVVNRHKDDMPEEVKVKLRWILQYKKAASLLSKFGQKMIDAASYNGYIYPSWFQIGTDENSVDSGRCSCKKPNMMQMPSRGDLWVTRWVEKNGKQKPLYYTDTGEIEDGVNVTQFFRRSFISEDGWVLVDADYSQEEPRIACDFCNEKNMIAEFLKPGKTDIHSIIGRSMCGLGYYPQKGEYERDYIGKTAGLQLLYGAYWKSLMAFMFQKTDGKVDWKPPQAEAAYNNFFNDYPAFKVKMEEVGHEMRRRAEQAGYTLAPFKKDRKPFAVAWTYFGRARRFCLSREQMYMPDVALGIRYKKPVIDPKTKQQAVDEDGNLVYTSFNTYKERMSAASREGFNHHIQGTAADILKFAIREIHYEFLKAGFDWNEGIVAVIHDEILCHVKEEHAQIASEIMQRCMKDAFEKFIKSVPAAMDLHVAKSWAEAKG